jgi:DNA-binding HxlR family transcriptional regulator
MSNVRTLERDGLITRAARAKPTQRAEYELTALGRGLPEPLDAACAWAREHGTSFSAREAPLPFNRAG